MNLVRMHELLCEEMDWDAILALAEEHGIQGVLAKRLAETEYRGVPAAAREKLQAQMRARHLFGLSLTAELLRILADFSKANIEIVPIKGPVISQSAYGDPAVRSYSDLDLLLRQRDIQQAMQRMIALGFEPRVPLSVLQMGKIPGEYVFKRPGTPCIVELHTEQTFRHYPKPMRVEEMFARKRHLLMDGKEVPALSLEDELVLSCIHGAKDFWERLMWVSDVAAITAKDPEVDWLRTRRFASEVGAERMLRVGILLPTMLFGTDLPGGVAEDIRRDGQAESLCAEIQEWLPYASYRPPSLRKQALYRMRMAGGGLAGALYLLRLSLSPAEEDWEERAEQQSSWFWEAVRRPFRLIRKYGSDE
jgi:hypothetical protein